MLKCMPRSNVDFPQSIAKNVNQSIHCVVKIYISPVRSSVHEKIVLNHEF